MQVLEQFKKAEAGSLWCFNSSTQENFAHSYWPLRAWPEQFLGVCDLLPFDLTVMYLGYGEHCAYGEGEGPQLIYYKVLTVDKDGRCYIGWMEPMTAVNLKKLRR